MGATGVGPGRRGEVEGDDAALAAAVRGASGRPRASSGPTPAPTSPGPLGLHVGGATPARRRWSSRSTPCGSTADDRELFAVNMVVVGTAPDRRRLVHRRARAAGRVDGRVVHDGPATGGRRRERPVPPGQRRRPAWPPGRRPGRGAGVRRAGRGSGPRCAAGCPRACTSRTPHRPGHRPAGRGPGRARGRLPARARRGRGARRPRA